VRHDLFRALRLLVVPAVALVAVVAFLPGQTGLAIRIFALVVCGAALLLMLAALRRAYPREGPLRRSAPQERRSRPVPGTLARLEQETVLGVAGSFDLHFRLRPRLRGLATDLLAARRNVSLDDSPGRARELVGQETWELVRDDRPPPEDRLARGLPINDLRHVVESLERL
jgi:hypothetical protein